MKKGLLDWEFTQNFLHRFKEIINADLRRFRFYNTCRLLFNQTINHF